MTTGHIIETDAEIQARVDAKEAARPAHYYQARFYFRLPTDIPGGITPGAFVMSDAISHPQDLAGALKSFRELGWVHGWMEYTWTAPSAETLQADFNEFIEARQ